MNARIELRDGEDDVIQFLDTLCYLYGTRRTSLVRLVRSTQAFQDWRRKVEYCGVCQRFVLVEKDPANPGGIRFEEHQRCENPENGFEACRGSGRATVWSGDRDIHPPDIVTAHIDHLIQHLQPGLL